MLNKSVVCLVLKKSSNPEEEEVILDSFVMSSKFIVPVTYYVTILSKILCLSMLKTLKMYRLNIICSQQKHNFILF